MRKAESGLRPPIFVLWIVFGTNENDRAKSREMGE